MKVSATSVRFFHIEDMELVEGYGVHAFPMHTHTVFCIGVVTEGRLLIQFGRQAPLLLTRHQVYFIPPFTPHTIQSADGLPYGYCAVCIPGAYADAAGTVRCKRQVILAEAFGEALLKACREYQNSRDGSCFYPYIQGIIKENVVFKPCNTAQKVQLAVNCAHYIANHLYEPFCLQKLSEYAHVSKYYLVRCFEEQMGVAPYRYYMQEKVKKIRQGLLNEQPAADIAYALQFTDQSHLCNVFKKYVGIAPGRFKDSYREA